MKNVYHLLNGDALKEQFPTNLAGEKIVFRECMVDGPVAAITEEIFYAQRIEFLRDHYGAKGKEEYTQLFLSQMERVDKISNASSIYLWFEMDLFCQTNLWYCLDRLNKKKKSAALYLVSPPNFSPYSFGILSSEELKKCYEKAIPIKKIKAWSDLWKAYQVNDTKQMMHKAEDLKNEYPFVNSAVVAHIERIPSKNNLGRPLERLKTIQKEMNSAPFGKIFQAFCETEAHYGFGDLTVKRLWKELNEKS